VGLVARVVEQTGIPTVTVSTARDLSLQVMPPRTVFLNHPMGNTFGRRWHAPGQRQILRAASGIVTARLQAERTGTGAYLDLSMLEATTALLATSHGVARREASDNDWSTGPARAPGTTAPVPGEDTEAIMRELGL